MTAVAKKAADDLEKFAQLLASRERNGRISCSLLSRLGVVKFPEAAFGIDDYSLKDLHGTYGSGFRAGYTMVFVGEYCGCLFLFDSVEQLDKFRGEFDDELGFGGVRAAYSIPNSLWYEVVSRIDRCLVKDFCSFA